MNDSGDDRAKALVLMLEAIERLDGAGELEAAAHLQHAIDVLKGCPNAAFTPKGKSEEIAEEENDGRAFYRRTLT